MWKNSLLSSRGAKLGRALFAGFLLLLLPSLLSSQESSSVSNLPEWLKMPEAPQVAVQDQTQPLVLRLADRLEWWDNWSIEVESWYQELQKSVSQTLISLRKQEEENQALRMENSLLRGQLQNQTTDRIMFGGGGFLAGLATGLTAGFAILK